MFSLPPPLPLLQLHPDKGGDASAFARLQSAFEILSDSVKLQQWQRSQTGISSSASEAVDIDVMLYDGAGRCFKHPCRCGDVFVVPEEMLDLR